MIFLLNIFYEFHEKLMILDTFEISIKWWEGVGDQEKSHSFKLCGGGGESKTPHIACG